MTEQEINDLAKALEVVSALSIILGLNVRTDAISDDGSDLHVFWDTPLEERLGPVPVTFDMKGMEVGVEWYGLYDKDEHDPEDAELLEAEAKLHRIVAWCRGNKVRCVQHGAPRWKRNDVPPREPSIGGE